nr:hypothetical protein [Rhizorhabdus wittichii]
MRAFVGVLKTSPTAHIVDENRLIAGLTGQDIPEHVLERIPSLQMEAAPSFVRIGLDDPEPVQRGIAGDRRHLVGGRVYLLVGRHADILGGGDQSFLLVHPHLLRPKGGAKSGQQMVSRCLPVRLSFDK